MEDIRKDIPRDFNFLFTESHAEVISGKQEGVYAWIAMNYILGKFEHMVGGKCIYLNEFSLEWSTIVYLVMFVFKLSSK